MKPGLILRFHDLGLKELAIRQDTLYLSAAQTESSGCVLPQPEYCDFSDWNF